MLLKISGIKRQVLISSCLYIGQMIAGFTISWSGPVIPKLRDLKESPFPYLLTETMLSLVATSSYSGCIIGPYVTLWLSNVKGRKPCFMIGGILASIAYILIAAAQNLVMLQIGRILIGVAMATISVMNLVYIGEIASTNIRGSLLATLGLFHTLGSILLFAVGPYVSYTAISCVGLALSLIFTFCTLWLPESPIFHMLQGKNEEVIKILQDLGRLEDLDSINEMRKEFDKSNNKREWVELFTVAINRKALFIVIVLNVFQASCGLLAVVFFAAKIFEMAGSSISWNVAMIMIGFFQLTGSMFAPFFIERIGRKVILSSSCVVCSLSMFLLGLYFYLDYIESPVINNVKWLPLVLLIFFNIGYDSGFGIVPNAIIGEMFVSNVRSKGSTVTMSMSWLFGFIVNTAFGVLLEIVGGHVAFWFFSGVCACAFIFTVFCVPETKGKTLLEIQQAL